MKSGLCLHELVEDQPNVPETRECYCKGYDDDLLKQLSKDTEDTTVDKTAHI